MQLLASTLNGNGELILHTQPSHSLLELARGNQPGISVIRKFGVNEEVGATEEAVWPVGGPYNFLQAALPLRIKAGGNAADDAAGAGAQTVALEGLDASFAAITATLTTAGVAASAPTAESFIRLNRACVINVGTYGGTNVGDIEIETTGGITVGWIAGITGAAPASGQTEQAIYTVPAGTTAYLGRMFATVESGKPADIFVWRRENADDISTPFTSRRMVESHHGVQNVVYDRSYDAMPSFPEKTDIYVTALRRGGADVALSVQYDLFLV